MREDMDFGFPPFNPLTIHPNNAISIVHRFHSWFSPTVSILQSNWFA
jgi:hypothetical protein